MWWACGGLNSCRRSQIILRENRCPLCRFGHVTVLSAVLWFVIDIHHGCFTTTTAVGENIFSWYMYHYNDVIVNAMASQITSLTIVYSTVYSRRRSKKTSKLRVTGRCEGNSPVNGEFPFVMQISRGSFWVWARWEVTLHYKVFRH